MILGKELTLEETLKELKKLKYRLLELNEKLKIGFFEMKAITWKDIVTKSSFKGDVMLSKMIKADGTREEFDAVKESFEGYRQIAIQKISDMLEKESEEYCITYFRDKLKWKWDDIAKMFNCGERQCRRKYKNYKEK